MSMLRHCSAPGCSTRTLGEFCVEHEAPVAPPMSRVSAARRSIATDRRAARLTAVASIATGALNEEPRLVERVSVGAPRFELGTSSPLSRLADDVGECP